MTENIRLIVSQTDKQVLTAIAKQDGDISMSAAVRRWLRSEAKKRGIETVSQESQDAITSQLA